MEGMQKSFGTKDVLAMAFGSMIGWGWIMLSGTWAREAGMLGAILAYGVCAILCICVGLVYAELTAAIPYTGGSVVFAFKSMGPRAAAVAGLATAFSYLGVAAWEGPAFASAIDYLVHVPQFGYLWTIRGYEVYISWALIAMAASVLITLVNIIGSKATAMFQTAATVGILIVGVLFIFGAVRFGSADNVEALFTTPAGFMSVMLMGPAMFVGFDVIPQSAGEMNVPLKKIPGILVVSIIGAAMWYMLMIFSTCFSAPGSLLSGASIPVADAMAYAFQNPVWGKICIIGALLGILTSWNGFMFGAARCLYSMARAGLLPEVLGKIDPKHGTPRNAILFCGFISTFSCVLGKSALTWFVNASSFSVVLMYGISVLAFVLLRRNQPDMIRPYKISNGKILGACAVLVVLFFLYLYLPFGPSSLDAVEWGMVIGWFLIGGLVVMASLRKTRGWSYEQRASMLFHKD